jgi:SNF2 family DNA or RNA helicase
VGLSGAVNARWQKYLYDAVELLGCPERLETTPPDPSFQGKLLPYQQKGVDWLVFLHRFGFGGLLADEMGLGKTVQFLAFFSLLRTKLPILIVAPTSLLYHWRAEFRRFLPEKSVLMHSGGDRVQELSLLQGASFVLTSYAILRQDVALFSNIEFEAAVLDESNAIKNSDTRAAAAALRLNTRSRFCLSGTPIENRLSELAAQFAFLMPDLLKSKDSAESMQRKSRPFLLRRRKTEVQIDLPEKIESIAWVELAEGQKEIYEEFQKSALKRIKPKVIEDGAGAHRMEILEAILRLRQICCDPRLVGREAESAKLGLLLEDLQNLFSQGSKALVYSQFTSMLDSIESSCRPFGWKVLRIDGSTPVDKRGAAVDEFQNSEEPVGFLLSLKAGGVGLNLTAADYVLLFDPWWNEAVEKQAVDRAHRIGRKQTVFTKRYLTPNSIEEKMLRMKEVKQSAADQILDGGTLVVEEMSADEWLNLLETD